MQEQVSFTLRPEFVSVEITELSLYHELMINLAKIQSLLVSYHYKSRERVLNVTFSPDSVKLISAHIGKLEVNYLIGQFSACADLDYQEKAKMEILVDLDIVEMKAVLTGEFIPERDPDEF